MHLIECFSVYPNNKDENDLLHVNDTCPRTESLNMARNVEVFFNVLIISVGGTLNLIVLFTHILANRIHGFSTAAMYLTNLCISNLLTIFSLPYIMMQNFSYMSGSTLTCKFVTLLYYASCTNGLMTLAWISMDRYRIINQRVRKDSSALKNTYKIMGATWFASLLCAGAAPMFTTLINHDNVDPENPDYQTCVTYFRFDQIHTLLSGFTALVTIVWGIIPVMVMSWFYTFFYRTLKRASCKKRNRTIAFICILLCSFLCLQVPFTLLMMYETYVTIIWKSDCADINALKVLHYVSRLIPNMHCLLNPILYAFIGNDFITRLKECFRGELFNRRQYIQSHSKCDNSKISTLPRPTRQSKIKRSKSIETLKNARISRCELTVPNEQNVFSSLPNAKKQNKPSARDAQNDTDNATSLTKTEFLSMRVLTG
ncbi:GP33 [Caviid betaherpesvirus 2]|uniref:GP33 n=1 Tax=Guinea pig cytomegalovirus (strain 22122) TaxID=103920 RepID=B7TPV3_GPCMV|nr:GP33 [Caviid betaherpesvirus 2]AGE11511.1 GP33 [Caviid betaherpesvirus 2]AIL83899.1 GP33 [BAC cloning vector GPN13BACdenovo_preserved(MM)]BAJ78501.1 GP33 [Caviid betaherpesvirus 2]